MFGWKRKILGVDLGQRSLKGAVLSRRGEEVCLESYFYYDLKESLDTDQPADPPAVLSALVDGSGLRGHYAASAVDDKELQIANMSFPALTSAELRAAVLNELEAKTGSSVKDLAVDYVIAQKTGGALRESQVNAYYTKLSAVKEQLGVLEQAQLRPFSLEGSLLASVEALRFNGYIQPGTSYVVVDVGESHTSVGLVLQEQLVQVNVIRLGTGEINRSLMQELQCSYRDSELMKISHRIEPSENTGSMPTTPEAKLVEQGYYQIIVGIHDNVAYFRASRKDQTLSSILLTGGGSLKAGLASLIHQSLNIPVVVPNALKNIQIFPEGQEGAGREPLPELGSMLHVAIGLALRGVA